MVVGRKMDNERSVLRSNKEFSSQLQETNDFETRALLPFRLAQIPDFLVTICRSLISKICTSSSTYNAPASPMSWNPAQKYG